MIKVFYSELDDRFWINDGDGILWFDSSLEANDALRAIEIRAAVDAEIKHIVTWLRDDGNCFDNEAFLIASMLEDGKHHNAPGA